MSELGILPNPIPFGKYYLLERVNIGGMAEIFKAKAFGVEGFERLLAVKKILANIAEDEAFINMFIDEAKIAGQLNHPNIAQIFDLGKVEGSYFIALEYISGKDLKTIFERSRRLGEKVSIPRICYILMKICEGLGHAHTKKDAQGGDLNIVHRDVSPQNILISYEGEAKIIDFGIAKAQGKTSQTQVGILKGKFSYMSPEQVRGLHIDHRSDIFSLGIVLYEMLTLERLFLGESDFDTLEKIRKVEMSPPSLYNPHIPKELEDIVLKALAKSPEDRFQNAAEFDDALQRFMRNQGYYYTNKDLGSYMKESFSADIEFENKKLEYYRSLNLQAPVDTPPVLPMTGAHIAVNAGNGRPNAMPGLSWGDDEKDTQIYNRDTHSPDESIVESLIDADIIFSEDLEALDDELETTEHHDPPTVEYNRDALAKSLEEFSFDDVPPSRKSSPGLPRQPMPTSRLPSIEPRRESSMTIPNAPMPQRNREKSSAPVILGAMALVIAIGGGVIFMFWPWPAEVNFAPTPSDVTITVDGVQIFEGTAPHTYKIKPGIHAVEISSEGYEPYTLKQEFQSRITYNIKRELKKAGDAAPDTSNNPTLLVTTTPADAVVELNGKKFEQESPKEIKDFPPGGYTLKITATGYEPLQQKLDLTEDGAKVELSLVPLKFVADISSDPSRSSFELYDKDNGKLVTKGKTPEKVKDLDASKTYRLVIASKGMEDFEKILEPSNDTERKIEAKLQEEQKTVASVTEPVRKDPVVKKNPDPVRKDPIAKKDPEPIKKDPIVKKDPDPPKKDPPKKDPPTGVATLTIGSRPAARIFIDGKDTGKYTPLKDYKISATKHKIELVNDEFNLKKTYYVDLKPGESKRIINK